MKADVAFEMFDILGQPFYCFHDADMRPEGEDLCRKPEEPERGCRLHRREAAEAQSQASVGHVEPLFAPALDVGCGHEP
jgi:hypothetical protein